MSITICTIFSMYILLRYTLIFLVLLHLLSHKGPSYVLLDDVSSLQLWGNHAHVSLEEGKGRIEIESEIGFSFLFSSPSGTSFSFCFGECSIQMYVPSKNRVAMWFDEAALSASGIDTLQVELRSGSVHLKDIAKSDISLYRGSVDVSVSPNGMLNLRGEELNGEIHSYGDGWKHEVLHKGALFEEEQSGQEPSLVHVQFFRGRLNLLRDSVVMSVPE